MPPLRRRHGLSVVLAVVATIASWTLARAVDERSCLKAKYRARARDITCFEKAALCKRYCNTDLVRDYEAFGKCTDRYLATWAREQAKAAGLGTSCDLPRFVDNGDGTVTDNLTGLQWEKKTNLNGVPNPGDAHDADNVYSLNEAGDGTAFTTFLPALNSACFSGRCDWRLPTIAELRTLLLTGYLCQTNPCVDAILGPQASANTWSNTNDFGLTFAWYVDFADGTVATRGKSALQAVRAVRGGISP